jgi:hypothetical protein
MSTSCSASRRRRVMSSSAWLGSATPEGLVMRQDHCGGIVLECLLDDFARVDRCPIDRAAEQILAGDQAMTVVEVDQSERFEFAVREPRHQVVPGPLRRVQLRAFPDTQRERLARPTHDFLQGRGAEARRGVDVGGVKNGSVHGRLPSCSGGIAR